MFLKRLGSGIILVILAIVLLYFGEIPLAVSLLVISLVGTFEFLRAVKLEKKGITAIAYIAVICYYLLLYFKRFDLFVAVFVAVLLMLLTVYVLWYPKYNTENITMIFFAVIYVGVLLSFVYRVRCLEDGRLLVWLIFASAWGSDTCAYVSGMLFGKHKLPSRLHELSPKKTIEGCIGGIVGAALIGFGFSFLYKESGLFFLSPMIVFAITGAVGSIISQIGDLAASAIKRNHEIKDYGDIIPGHGGILDRFDSIIFVAPVVYYLLVVLSEIQ